MPGPYTVEQSYTYGPTKAIISAHGHLLFNLNLLELIEQKRMRQEVGRAQRWGEEWSVLNIAMKYGDLNNTVLYISGKAIPRDMK